MTKLDTEVTEKQVIVRKKKSGVAFLMMDCSGKVNVLSSSVIFECEDVIDLVETDPEVKAVVIISAKPDSFNVGADLHEIMKFQTEAQAFDLSRRGQKVFNQLASLSKPTVAAVNGICLGGGLELALCCDRRIATSSASTRLGLPEVRLGLIPGLGGTQRLPRLIGVKGALEIILGTEPVSAERAKEMGIVEEIVSADDLMDRAEALALELIDIDPKERKLTAPPLEAEKQKKLFAMTERSLRIKTKGKYPAPTAALRVIQTGLSDGVEVGLQAEAEAFGALSIGEISRNMIFLFFTTEFARATAAATAAKVGKEKGTIAIIGGGFMGLTLARLAAASGNDVLLRTAHRERQNQAMDKLKDMLQADIKKDDQQRNTGKVTSVESDEQLQQADLIIEACEEDETTKIEVLRQIEKHIKPDAVLVTNTSSLSVIKLSQALENKPNFLGLHFFNPVDRMPLVELISHPQTDKTAVARAGAFAHQLGKIPVKVQDSPGFLVNRILSCYLTQAARLAEARVPMNWLEDAAIDFGMPMGPMTVMDEVGMDVANMVAQALHKAFGDRLEPPTSLKEALRIGFVGKKTGRGVFLWNKDKKIEFNPQLKNDLNMVVTEEKAPPDQCSLLAEAMILPMVDEAARCLDEKLVRRAREIDLCMVMGLGFPAFRGGLLKYADSLGIEKVIERLQFLYNQPGPKRQVSEYLLRLAEQNRGFYSRGSED